MAKEGFGALGKGLPDVQRKKGIEIEIPDGATSEDLLDHLEISSSQMAVVSVEGRILKADDRLQAGSSVNVFQAVFGG